jgi:hypothetical protein
MQISHELLSKINIHQLLIGLVWEFLLGLTRHHSTIGLVCNAFRAILRKKENSK